MQQIVIKEQSPVPVVFTNLRPVGDIRGGLPRPLEACLAFLGLLACAPLIGLAALAVRLTSRGGAFFRQNRMGRGGRPFALIKLRTMTISQAGPQVTSGNDARVTRVGGFLRKTKLDELPELWNVLKGDMSLVGPRPEVPQYVDLQNPLWQTVLRVRPGLTDPVTLRLRNEENLLAEVAGSIELFYLEKLQPFKLIGYLEYCHRRTWLEDMKVLGRTAVAIIRPNLLQPPTISEINHFASKVLCKRQPQKKGALPALASRKRQMTRDERACGHHPL